MTDQYGTPPRPHGVYDSGEAVESTLEVLDERKKAVEERRALSGLFGIPQIDEYMQPAWPGDVIYTCGLPSMMKSYFMRMRGKKVVETLMDYGDTNRVYVCVTTEDSVQKVTAYWLAAMSGVPTNVMLSGGMEHIHRVSLNAVVAEVASWPLYVVGHSVAERHGGIKEKSARLSRDEIDMCLDYIQNKQGKDIMYITLDYIHRIRNDRGADRESHIRDCVDWTRDMGIWCGCPVEVGAQAKSKVAEKKYAVPTLDQVEWTMNAGQTADVFFGLFMPKVTMGPDSIIEDYAGWKNLRVKDTYLFVSVGKQKDAPAGKVFLLDTEPGVMKWHLMVPSVEELNPTGLSAEVEDPYRAPSQAKQQAINF